MAYTYVRKMDVIEIVKRARSFARASKGTTDEWLGFVEREVDGLDSTMRKALVRRKVFIKSKKIA